MNIDWNTTQDEADLRLAINSLVSRYELAGSRGSTHMDRRDMYTVLGYPISLSFTDFEHRYERQDIAERIIDFPAKETWSKNLIIYDGDTPPAYITYEDFDGRTPFEKAVINLVYKHNLYSVLDTIDRMSGIGKYGVLLLGFSGGGSLQSPVKKFNGVDDLLYLTPYKEDLAVIQSYEMDERNKRFGLPKIYQLTAREGIVQGKSLTVHASRILHVAEKASDRVFGTPRLKAVFNRLIDLEKLAGGGAEATWKLMLKGFLLDIDPEYSIDEEEQEKMREQIEEWDMGLRRFLMTRGVKVSDLGSDVVDPSGLYQILIELVSANTGIPKRVLVGSERGELASSQDAQNWARVVRQRQLRYAEPTSSDAY